MRLPILLCAALLISSSDAPANSPHILVYGDSISAGTGQNLADPRLWPNRLDRLLDASGGRWTIVNRSINGNGLVWRTRCFGEPALDRLKADIPALGDNERIIIVMAGVNDVIQPALPPGFSDCFDPADLPQPAITARLATLQRSAPGRRIIIATIPPFAASEFYTPEAQRNRARVNDWIRAHWPRKDVIELDRVLADKADATKLAPEFDSGDGLHPNEKGAIAIATAVVGMIGA